MAALIDWHSHHAPSAVIDRVVAYGRPQPRLDEDDSADFELRRRQLDEAGIDLQLVALPATIDTESLPPEQALALAQVANDALAERVNVDPQRFLGVISVTMKDIPGSVAEVQRMAGRGFRAVMLFPRCDGEMLVDTPEAAPLFATIAALDLPVFLHGGGGMPNGLRLDYLEDDGAGLTSSIINEAGICEWAVRAIACGLFDRHPNLRVVIRSGGGLAPMLINRLNHRHLRADGSAKDYRAVLLQHFAVDSRTDPRTLSYIIDHMGEQSLVFGSDFGGGSGGMKHSLISINRQPDPERVKALTERNTRRLLKI